MTRLFICFVIFFPALCYSSPYQKIDACVEYWGRLDHVYVVKVDLTCRSVKLISTDEQSKAQTTTKFAIDSGALVAINGDYFTKNYSPMGLAITNGVLWQGSKDKIDRGFFACDRENHCFVDSDDSVLGPDKSWNLAIGGWQTFSNGRFSCSGYASKGCVDLNLSAKHPRTAIGFNQSMNHLFIVVVEGRIKGFQGVTLFELGDIFNSLGIVSGLNLDGGGSSTLVVKGKRVNALPDGQVEERVVANHFGIRVE